MAGAIDTSKIAELSAGLGRVGSLMGVALQAELVRTGTEAKVDINASHERPYATGRLRRSVELSADPGAVSLWSSVVYSRIWEYGGTVTPNGSPINFPRLEYASKEIRKAGANIDIRLGATLDEAITPLGFV